MLVGLAEFFGVTLDFLILGRESTSLHDVEDERQSMAHYVDWTLADVRERTSAHTWFVSRIGQAVAERIDEVAREVHHDWIRGDQRCPHSGPPPHNDTSVDTVPHLP